MRKEKLLAEEKENLRAAKRRERINRRESARSAKQQKHNEWRERNRYALLRVRRCSYHLLAIAILSGVALMGFMRVPGVCLRFWEAMRDLCHTFVTPTVGQLPYGMEEGFPRAIEELAQILKAFGSAFISWENFCEYLSLIGRILLYLCYILAYGGLPIVLFLAILLWRSGSAMNEDHGKISKPLQIFLRFRKKVLLPTIRYLKGLIRFFVTHKKYLCTLILIAVFFLNGFTIVLEFLAFYLYFCFSDIGITAVGVQVIKLLYDLWLAFRFLPLLAWGGIALYVFHTVRKRIGYAKLERQEISMREFLDERGVNILVCGPPRTGKTTLVVSLVKSRVAMMRNDAHDGMRDIERKFPDFPWIVLEKMIQQEFKYGKIRTLHQVRRWVQGIITAARRLQGTRATARFCKNLQRNYGKCSAVPFEHPFFNYDTERFKTVYNGGLGKEKIEDLVETYAMLYLIYIQRALLIANFSVRMDDDYSDYGNFPAWRDDFFRHDPDDEEDSIFAHIFNQDLIRPGKQMDSDCAYANAYEYGLLSATEWGKERGNQFDRAGLKRDAPDANILNDLLDSEIKLMGHKGTVYFKRFAGFIADEQRANSVGANCRELFDLVTIAEKGQDKILMPFFTFEEAAYLIMKSWFGRIYDRFRENRGDTTLTMYLLKHFCKMIYDHYAKVFNRFGGHFLKVNIETGMRSAEGKIESLGDLKRGKLFISNVKVYANVFRTDAWRGVLEERAARSEAGLSDIPCYQGVEATIDEFKEQRSYFFRDLLKVYAGEGEKEKMLDVLIREMREISECAERAFGKESAIEFLGNFTMQLPALLQNAGDDVEKVCFVLRRAGNRALDEWRKTLDAKKKSETQQMASST